MKTPIILDVNGRRVPLSVEPRRTLLDALRHDCQLSGCKKGCDMGNCGACTVVLEGKAVYACLVLAVECDGMAVETVEGLARDGDLHPLQQAFIDHDAFQCGYCTGGQLMSLKALFDREPAPRLDTIRAALAGNLCRCGAYNHILLAAQALASAAPETDGE